MLAPLCGGLRAVAAELSSEEGWMGYKASILRGP